MLEAGFYYYLKDYIDIFLVLEFTKYSRLSKTCYTINLIKGVELLYLSIYNLSIKELTVLQEYLKNS